MTRKKFSDEDLHRLRAIPLLLALNMLGVTYKKDQTYKPKKSQDSLRVIVTLQAGNCVTLQITGIRWYDKNVDKGGGGAIDLVMYLFGMSFREAVELLQKREKAGRLEVERGK